ncbi:IS3 family transposase [Blautia wexlerae]|uniref:IS3 family transposase n=1 Tax=Blautia wexlerae TaxID=418240 RepID=UPI0022E21443|nr:IS3 family transposase [Blautia wexlerae]
MPISQEELDCKSIIDRLHTDNPAWGARQLSAQLKKRGHQVGRRKTRRYMNEMGIDPIIVVQLSRQKSKLFIMN